MQKIFQRSTAAHEGLYDITSEVEAIVAESGVDSGFVNVIVQSTKAEIMMEL